MKRVIRAGSSHLALADFTETDLEAVHAYAGDPRVSRYSLWGPNSLEESAHFLADALMRREDRLLLAVCFDGNVIGSASVWVTDEAQQIGELGYTLHQDYWGQGIGTEVAQMLVDLGISQLGLQRILATCDARNIGSIRVLEKAGLKLFDRRPESAPAAKGRNETLVFAVESERTGLYPR
ncbi:GNAT family N-acetyltransferase [Glutamicibacter sp. JC586]|uniref:GNAT family N-acetyltransferase n=1 Tax=Glutamicibacter sp. JC586 TaxID=2590552 RepID=UPI00135938D8|nr:GNAT family N-acetyltransferase [Glutamicibacter sp. JC586]